MTSSQMKSQSYLDELNKNVQGLGTALANENLAKMEDSLRARGSEMQKLRNLINVMQQQPPHNLSPPSIYCTDINSNNPCVIVC